jgi:predicted alpha/beta superfamily hydrolase
VDAETSLAIVTVPASGGNSRLSGGRSGPPLRWSLVNRAAYALLLALGPGCRPDAAPERSTDGTDEGSSSSSSTAIAESDGSEAHGDTTGADDTTTATPPDLPPPSASACDRLLELQASLADTIDVEEEAALIDAFVLEMIYAEDGLPIVEDERTCFLHLGEPGLSLSVAGDFDAWAAGEVPMLQAETGLGFYAAIVEMPRAEAIGLYKLVRDGDVFFADPHARRFGWDEFGEYSVLAPDPDRSHYERWPGFDLAVGDLDPRDLTVYVPAGASATSELPLLVMHDGQNLFAPDAFFGGWKVGATLDAAIARGDVRPLLVVGVDNTPDRMDEYTHVADDLGGMLVGGRAAEYADFIVDGVLPFVTERYPVSGAPEDTGVLGSSLGGLVSLYIAWAWPDRFGHAGSMSGTVGWGSFGARAETILDLYASDPPLGLRIYLDSGGGEGLGCPNGDSDNYCDNVTMAEGLRSLGWADDLDLFYRWEPDAPHNEAAWAARLRPALAEWFPGPRE